MDKNKKERDTMSKIETIIQTACDDWHHEAKDANEIINIAKLAILEVVRGLVPKKKIYDHVMDMPDEQCEEARFFINAYNQAIDDCISALSKITDEQKYPCADCGKLRTKDEGGTTFTVCDECWDKHYKKSKEVEYREALEKILDKTRTTSSYNKISRETEIIVEVWDIAKKVLRER